MRAPEARRWALLAAPRGSGKTALAATVVAALGRHRVRVAGVLQRPVLDGDGARVGYRVERIARAAGDPPEGLALARPAGVARPGEEEFCSFLFDAGVFAAAAAWIAEDAASADVVVVDEVSKLEVAGRGHAAAVAQVLRGPALPLLSVREDQLFAVMERFGLDEPVAAGGADAEALAAAIARALATSRR